MSVMTPTKRPSKKNASRKSTAAEARAFREAEAPDRGESLDHSEAPDSGRLRKAEAPDAGDGRAAALEQEFTHGRSQS
jgi:hypothetical protein